MPAETTIHRLADRLGLDLSHETDHLALRRHAQHLELRPDPLAGVSIGAARDRHVVFCVLAGVRLALDRLASTFDVTAPAPKPHRTLHYHEKPSIYGERMPRLTPALAVRWFEAVAGLRAFTTPWVDPSLLQIYVLEVGKHLHTLSACDVARLDTHPEKIERNARHALFYDAYKLKPRKIARYEGGMVRIFQTVEGLGASRAVLLPDFDYDAAREGGTFAIPSRDHLVIGRPESVDAAEAIAQQVAQHAQAVVESADFPLSNRVWKMDERQVVDSSTFGAVELPISLEDGYAPSDFEWDLRAADDEQP